MQDYVNLFLSEPGKILTINILESKYYNLMLVIKFDPDIQYVSMASRLFDNILTI